MRDRLRLGLVKLIWLTVFLLVPAAAHADPISFDVGRAIILVFAFAIVFAVILAFVYTGLVVVVETLIVRYVLKMSLWEALGWMLIVNIVSFGLGGVLHLAGEGGGWKTAWTTAQWGSVALLWIRSLVISFVVESGLLAFMLRGRRQIREIMQATALANFASYVLALWFMAMLPFNPSATS